MNNFNMRIGLIKGVRSQLKFSSENLVATPPHVVFCQLQKTTGSGMLIRRKLSSQLTTPTVCWLALLTS